MKDLVLHPNTKLALSLIVNNKPHAIMLTGSEGSGKRHIALTLASEFLGKPAHTHPYFLHIEPAGKSLTIDQIRELQGHMRLKTTGKGDVRRVVVLQDVHTMTVEAQNALLKLLEEPPEDTILILTAKGDQSLKPTIYSRVQRVQVKPITKQQAQELGHNTEKQYEMSGGDVGLLTALINEDKKHELILAIENAKKLLIASQFERLSHVDELSKDKEKLKTLLAAIRRIANAALKSSLAKKDAKNAIRWTNILQNVHNTEGLLNTNVNTKLVLTELFLEF